MNTYIWIGVVVVLAILSMLLYKYKKNEIKEIKFSLLNYFKNFGWVYSLLVIFLIATQCLFYKEFPYVLILAIVFIFLYKPLKLVYMLIGPKNSLSGFMVLFIITQLLFAWAYSAYLSPSHSYIELIFNTFSTSLTQQPVKIFEDFLTVNKEWDEYGNVFILLNTQIFISWIYLGVLIAGLYQKLRNE